jgi:hypothetical protein
MVLDRLNGPDQQHAMSFGCDAAQRQHQEIWTASPRSRKCAATRITSDAELLLQARDVNGPRPQRTSVASSGTVLRILENSKLVPVVIESRGAGRADTSARVRAPGDHRHQTHALGDPDRLGTLFAASSRR